MTKKPLSALAFLLLGSFPLYSAASAPDPDRLAFYGGVNYGTLRMPQSTAPFDNYSTTYFNRSFEVLEFSSQMQQSKNSPGFTLGLRVNRYLAAEASVLGFGEMTYLGNGTVHDRVVNVPVNIRIKRKFDGLTASGIVVLPITRHWELYGRVGLAMLTTNPDSAIVSTVRDEIAGVTNIADDVENLFYGAGTTVYFSRHWLARLEAQRYMGAFDDTERKRPVDRLSFELSYTF